VIPSGAGVELDTESEGLEELCDVSLEDPVELDVTIEIGDVSVVLLASELPDATEEEEVSFIAEAGVEEASELLLEGAGVDELSFVVLSVLLDILLLPSALPMVEDESLFMELGVVREVSALVDAAEEDEPSSFILDEEVTEFGVLLDTLPSEVPTELAAVVAVSFIELEDVGELSEPLEELFMRRSEVVGIVVLESEEFEDSNEVLMGLLELETLPDSGVAEELFDASCVAFGVNESFELDIGDVVVEETLIESILLEEENERLFPSGEAIKAGSVVFASEGDAVLFTVWGGELLDKSKDDEGVVVASDELFTAGIVVDPESAVEL
jgi:hypothetical protein